MRDLDRVLVFHFSGTKEPGDFLVNMDVSWNHADYVDNLKISWNHADLRVARSISRVAAV